MTLAAFEFIRSDRALIIDLRGTTGRYLRLSSWGRGLQLQSLEGSIWKDTSIDPGLPLLKLCDHGVVRDARSFILEQRHAKLARIRCRYPLEYFVATEIPKEVEAALFGFLWKQLTSLQILRFCPDLLPLAQKKDALFLLLVDKIGSCEHDPVFVERLRRHSIDAVLNFAIGTNKPMVKKFIGKVKILEPDHASLQVLRMMLHDENLLLELYGHPGFDSRLISLVRDHRIVGTPLFRRLFTNLCDGPEDEALSDLRTAQQYMHRIFALRQSHGLLGPLPIRKHRDIRSLSDLASTYALTRIRAELCRGITSMASDLNQDIESTQIFDTSLSDLNQLHDNLQRQSRARDTASTARKIVRQYGIDTFVDPIGLSDTNGESSTAKVQRLRDVHDLVKEGREMKHCVGSLHREAMSGEAAFYRVLQPSRATLELRKRKSDGEVYCFQLKARSNRRVPSETRDAIKALLDTHNRTRRNGNGQQQNVHKSEILEPVQGV